MGLTILVSDVVFIIFSLDAANNCFWPSRTTLHTLFKDDQLFVFNCAADTTLHQAVKDGKFSNLWRASLWNLK
jgi:hypothetical protein